MTGIPAVGVAVAGFALAHAVWSVSDTAPAELLVPLLLVEDAAGRRLTRFEAATQQGAVALAEQSLAARTAGAHAWAFAREGVIRGAGAADRDVLSVAFWAEGMGAPALVVQAFARRTAAAGFRLLGEPEVAAGGWALMYPERGRVLELLRAGIEQHAAVAPLWDGWVRAGERPV